MWENKKKWGMCGEYQEVHNGYYWKWMQRLMGDKTVPFGARIALGLGKQLRNEYVIE